MRSQVTEFLVFLASPTDVSEERTVVRELEADVNALVERLGVRVRIVGWEQVPPDGGAPQDQINPLVERCDAFIGVLGRRWGTATEKFSSGFAEEFALAIARRQNGEPTPAIGMYFAEIPESALADQGPQLKKVVTFKRRVERERLALYEEYRSPDHLSKKVLEYLVGLVFKAVAVGESGSTQATGGAGDASGPSSAETSEVMTGDTATADGQLDAARRQISEALRGFDDLVRGTSGDRHVDQDRITLIANGFAQEKVPLQGHLVHRIYRRREELHLSIAEAHSWWRTFLSDHGRNRTREGLTIPAWAVLDPNGSRRVEAFKELLEFASGDDAQISRGAFRVIPLFGTRIADALSESGEGSLSTEASAANTRIKWWRAAFATLPGLDIAFDYLVSIVDAEKAVLSEIPSEEMDDDTAKVITALAGVLDGDLTRLMELVPNAYTSDVEHLVDFVVAQIPQVDDDQLLELSKVGHPAVRCAAFRVLFDRGNADRTVLKSAMRWKDAEVDALILRRVAQDRTFAQAISQIVQNDTDIKGPDRLEPQILATLFDPAELRAAIAATVFGESEWEALTLQDGASLVDEAREILDTDAQSWRDRMSTLSDEHPTLADFIASRLRNAACVVLKDHSDDAPGDAIRLIRELQRDDFLTRESALLGASALVTPETIHLAADLELSQLDGYWVNEYVPLLMEGSLAPALAGAWSGSDSAPRRRAALRWRLSTANITEEELREATYDKDEEFRLTALDALLYRWSREQIASFLEEYYERDGTYWYNIIAALDARLYGPHPNSSVGTFTPRPDLGDQGHTATTPIPIEEIDRAVGLNKDVVLLPLRRLDDGRGVYDQATTFLVKELRSTGLQVATLDDAEGRTFEVKKSAALEIVVALVVNLASTAVWEGIRHVFGGNKSEASLDVTIVEVRNDGSRTVFTAKGDSAEVLKAIEEHSSGDD